jgi:hypothetical protein
MASSISFTVIPFFTLISSTGTNSSSDIQNTLYGLATICHR